ncbi:hypothetical protein BV22DRAFT_1127070 [Leucogyrophana mollusca]|uniref:Uncharacterized protein n=1 Tax=Leucogyrophana mollusca TaxID=85980 RepID=A0ACB8BR78_9AGAM|nr:hypothetical protein BV22DRAFT_1127070 [Leucogyrophana mollusca]
MTLPRPPLECSLTNYWNIFFSSHLIPPVTYTTTSWWHEEFTSVNFSDEEKAGRFISALLIRPEFAQREIKSLWIGGNVCITTTTEILRLCQGITKLALWTTPTYVPADSRALLKLLDTLSLKQLSFAFSLIHGGVSSEFPSLPSISLFNKVTHLELLEGWVLWSSCMGIHSLPQLTHLSLRASTKRTDPRLLRGILELPDMRAMVLRVTEDRFIVEKWLYNNGTEDRRVVLVHEIAQEARGSPHSTLWKYADGIVQWRTQNAANPYDVPGNQQLLAVY